MSNLIDTSTGASLCGSGTFVCQAKNESLTENADGSVVVTAGSQGSSDELFKVVVRAKGTAAKQLKVCRDEAQAKGVKGFKFMAAGPLEVELETNKLGKDDQPLSLVMAANFVRPVMANPQKDPLQNTAILCGRVVKTTFASGGTKIDLQFGHLTSEIQEGDAPAAVKLGSGTKTKLEDYLDQDVMLSGSFTRYTSTEQNGDIPPHDSISFTADSGQLIQIAAGKTRYSTKKGRPNSTATTGYEDEGNSDADNSALNNSIADMDF